MGARAGARRRPGGVWLRRTQDPRQAVDGGARQEAGGWPPIAMSAPAITTRSPRASIPICRSSPPIPRSGATSPRIFNFITGYGEPARAGTDGDFADFRQAPAAQHIEAESDTPGRDRPAAIWAKCNSLADPEIIDALYRASAAGVRDRTGRARHLLPAAGRSRPFGKHPRQVDRRPLSRTFAHLCVRQWPRACPRRRAGLHLFRRPDAAQPRSPRRNLDADLQPTLHAQILEQVLLANLLDNVQSWEILSRWNRQAHRARHGRGSFFRAELFHDQSPAFRGAARRWPNPSRANWPSWWLWPIRRAMI